MVIYLSVLAESEHFLNNVRISSRNIVRRVWSLIKSTRFEIAVVLPFSTTSKTVSIVNNYSRIRFNEDVENNAPLSRMPACDTEVR